MAEDGVNSVDAVNTAAETVSSSHEDVGTLTSPEQSGANEETKQESGAEAVEEAGDAEPVEEGGNADNNDEDSKDDNAESARSEESEKSGESEEENKEESEEEYNGVDEEVYKLKSHRRQVASNDAPTTERKEKRRQKGASSRELRSGSQGEPKSRQQRQQREPESPEEPQEPEDPEVVERRLLEERIDAALKPASKKRKRLTGDDLEQMQDEMIANLRVDMRDAALRDASCVNEGQPAVHKQQLLKRVQSILRQQGLAESILDGNLLESVRIWLEPLPDASLPSFEIQQTLFSALTTLPIKTIHLRESGLGRVVAFYQKSRRPHPTIKRMAQKLIGDWTRPIIGRSDNYRDRSVDTASFDPMNAGRMRRRSEPLTPYEESAARRNRAALPQANNTRYSVAPVASTAPMQQQRATDSQLRRMKTKLLNNARQSRGKKSGVSVEGRGLN